MGQLRTRKRGVTWQYSFEAARVNGQRKSIMKGGFRTKEEALKAGTQAMNEYNTQLGYMQIIENHLKPQFCQYKLKAITTASIQSNSCHRPLLPI